MTPTPVGMRCPECAGDRTPVKTMATVRRGGEPTLTYILIGISVLAFVGEMLSGGGIGQGGGSRITAEGALFGPLVADGEYWRLVTYGFLHSGIIHIGFNMYILWWLGTMLEPEMGRLRFGAIYFTALLAGAFGALLLDPNVPTVGASGAVFGLMGAALVEMRGRGMAVLRSPIGILLLLNLGITLLPGFNISIGGHIGGLIGGVLAAFVIQQADRRRPNRVLAVGGCAVLAAAAAAGAIGVA